MISINKNNFNLKDNITFQAFFAAKGNDEFLIDFLNSLLELNIDKVKIIEEVNLERLNKNEKGGRIDLQAVLEDGTIIDIEMQLKNEYNIETRSSFYASKLMARRNIAGMEYNNLRNVIIINILNFKLFDYEEYISESVTVLKEHREHQLKTNIKFYFIELPKFRKSNPDMSKKVNQWLAFIDNYDEEMVKMAISNNTKIEKATVQVTRFSPEEQEQYMEFLREKWEMDYGDAMARANRIGKEEGMAKGMEEGMAKGMEKGMEKGIKKGIAKGEKMNKIKIAKAMISKGMSIKLISEITELGEKELLNIK